MNADQSKQIEALYFELFDYLMAYARSCLGNRAIAEEAVQETFRIACQRPESACNSPNPSGWLFVTLKYVIRSTKKDLAITKDILQQYLTTQADEIFHNENSLSIEFTYKNIADTEEFQLLKEYAIEGRTIKEMAAARGITVDNCKHRVARARDKLKKKLKNCF